MWEIICKVTYSAHHWIGYVLQAAPPSIGSQKWVGTSHSGWYCCHSGMNINLLLSKTALGKPSLGEGDLMHLKGIWQLAFTVFQQSKKVFMQWKSSFCQVSWLQVLLDQCWQVPWWEVQLTREWRLKARIRSLQP